MRLKLFVFVIFCFWSSNACAGNAAPKNAVQSNVEKTAAIGKAENTSEIADNISLENNAEKFGSENESAANESQTKQPRTVRDFFMLLPEKYFLLESCEPSKDRDCRRAKLNYLKTFTEVEDTANGYLKGGCDGAQSCMEMALFKRPDGTYLVGLAVSAEMMEDYYFLDYKNGVWTDVSAEVVPEFSRKNMYEIPRKGTTVKVYAKKIIEKGDDYEIAEKGAKLYDLEWKDGKFLKQK